MYYDPCSLTILIRDETKKATPISGGSFFAASRQAPLGFFWPLKRPSAIAESPAANSRARLAETRL